ncbi:hypothetical protein [Alkalibacillus haloalkaliphilus]|uniref:hypothetical protein n=1 Tax=Alkalibacillus haloalkaliphilus TaxID=94136 RepID=UPI0002D9459A|nr:hypothetical protein [Alkalibacillus haloalkaliphilus]
MFKKDYIVKFVAIWGIISGILFFIYNQLSEYGLSVSSLVAGSWLIDFVTAILTFAIAGGVLGYMIWKGQLKRQAKGDHNA